MKHKSNLVTGICISALALCAPHLAFARGKKSASPAAEASASPAASATASAASKPAKERAFPFHGMVSAVDTKAKTFSITGKEKSRVFKISDRTVLTKSGATASIKDVAEKEEVRGSYWKSADGSLEARSVKLGPLTEEEKAAEEARKAKRAEKKRQRAAAAAAAATSPASSASPATSASPKP